MQIKVNPYMHEMGPHGREHNIFTHRVSSGNLTKLYM